MPAACGDSPKDAKDDADRAAVPMGLCTAPGSLDTHLCYAAWRSSYSSRASIGV